MGWKYVFQNLKDHIYVHICVYILDSEKLSTKTKGTKQNQGSYDH